MFFCLFLLVGSFIDLSNQQVSIFSSAYAQARFKAGKISITGNKKIEAEAIKKRLAIEEGMSLDSARVREAISNVFEMNYFYDVKVIRTKRASSYDLQFEVVEKPAIMKIDFVDNSELDDEELMEAIDLKQYSILDRQKIRESAEKIQKLYEDKGYFLAKVKTEVIEASDPEQGAALNFIVGENEKVVVRKVNLIGNEHLSDSNLKSLMLTQEGGFFSFFSDSGGFKEEMFDRDLQVLNLSYFNEGFIQVKIDRPEVYVTPDKKSIYITIRIEEGIQYNVGNIDFSGDLIFDREDLLKEVNIKDREVFSYQVLQDDLRALQAKYGDLGYAFANIIPRTRYRVEEKKVDIVFEVDKGNKVYFGEFSITGNTKTRDKVVRRELVVLEGELYNETRKRESVANIRRLGFFDDVVFKQKSRPESPEILDVEIIVKERNTGSLQVGAGYSNRDSFIFNSNVTEQNLFGRGQKFGLNIQYAKTTNTFKLSMTEPYWNDSQWSVGGEIFQIDNRENDFRPYKDLTRGLALRLGYPIAKYLRIYGGYRFEDVVNFSVDSEVDPSLYPSESVLGVTNILTGSIEYDSRNDRFSPSDGQFASLGISHAGLGGDHAYNSVNIKYQYFKNVFWDVVWRNNLVLGYIWNDGDEEIPFNKLFLLGGAYTLKGYDYGSVGERLFDSIKGEDVPFGGERQAYYNLEFEFPLVKEANIKGVVFYDMGFAYTDLDPGESLSDILQKDYGFGFRWFSPIGPLRFEWGTAINPKDYHDDRNFEFSIGAPF